MFSVERTHTATSRTTTFRFFGIVLWQISTTTSLSDNDLKNDETVRPGGPVGLGGIGSATDAKVPIRSANV